MIRLLMISFSSLSLLFFAVFGLRQLGMYQHHPQSNHRLFSKSPWLLLDVPIEALKSRDQYASWLQETQKTASPFFVLPVIPLHLTGDQHWIVTHSPALAQRINDQVIDAPINVLSKSDVETSEDFEKVIFFESLVANLPDQQPLVFEIFEKQPSQATEWTRWLSPTFTQDIIVLSPHKFSSRQHRKIFPQWVFGSDPATVLQAMVLYGLYLEPLFQMWADFWLSPHQISGRDVFSERLIAEFQRRNLKVVLDERSQTLPRENWPHGLEQLVIGFRRYRFP